MIFGMINALIPSIFIHELHYNLSIHALILLQLHSPSLWHSCIIHPPLLLYMNPPSFLHLCMNCVTILSTSIFMHKFYCKLIDFDFWHSYMNPSTFLTFMHKLCYNFIHLYIHA